MAYHGYEFGGFNFQNTIRTMSILHWPGHDLFGVCVDMFELLMEFHRSSHHAGRSPKNDLSPKIFSTPPGTMVVGDESTSLFGTAFFWGVYYLPLAVFFWMSAVQPGRLKISKAPESTRLQYRSLLQPGNCWVWWPGNGVKWRSIWPAFSLCHVSLLKIGPTLWYVDGLPSQTNLAPDKSS